MGCASSKPAAQVLPASKPAAPSDNNKSAAPSDNSASNGGATRSYPMIVMAIEDVLSLDALQPHEEVKDKLVEWREGMGDVLFCSHTWLRFKSPDDADGSKLALLQSLLASLKAGTLKVTTQFLSEVVYGADKVSIQPETLQACKYVWFDVFSIPQFDKTVQPLAIASIASYINDCSVFVCLAGPWRHENGSVRDVRAWSDRGWCRLEQLANALSVKGEPKPLIIAQSSTDILSYGPSGIQGRDWTCARNSVGNGNFTVDGDRLVLGPVIGGMVDARKAVALERGDLTTYRWLHASAARLCAGTGFQPPMEATLSEWLKAMRFETAKDGEGDGSGLTPLFYAAVAGRADLARALLADEGVNPNLPLATPIPHLTCPLGYTPLHTACTFADTPELIEVLLKHGADPTLRDPFTSSTPVIWAGSMGNHANVDAIVKAAPEQLTIENTYGGTPLGCAVLHGQRGFFDHFVQTQPELVKGMVTTTDGCGWSLCMHAVAQVGDVELLRLVIQKTLDAGASVDLCAPPTSPAMVGACQAAEGMAKAALEARTDDAVMAPVGGFVGVYGYGVGAPALHLASLTGNLGAVDALLALGGADPSFKSATWHAMAPLHVACMQGHSAVVKRLVEAGADPSLVDAFGRTPAQCAAAYGHDEDAQLAGSK